jgi:magnesium transporter
MNHSFTSLAVTESQEQALKTFRKYGRLALPVVNANGFLIGIVTIDDVMAVAEEADTEDIHKFGGLEALAYPYISTPVWQMVKRRAGWLVILLFGEMFTVAAMGRFEAEIAKAVILALFVPLIISSGGNSGSQAATLVIRAMALGEVHLRDWWRVMRRELASGLLLGAILGCIGFLRIAAWSVFTDVYGPHWPLVAVTLGLSLLGVVMWGTVVGSMLPFILRRLGFDPATSSAPLVATLVDVSGLLLYFSLAGMILRGTLL